MGSPEMGMSPEETRPDIGQMILRLLHTYANPKDSTEHAAIVDNIRRAVQAQNRDELIAQLTEFSRARVNDSGSEQAGLVEMFCARETRAVITALTQLEKLPWDELSTTLEAPPEAKPAELTPPPTLEFTEADRAEAEQFITDHVVGNNSLPTQGFKEFVANYFRTTYKSWRRIGNIFEDGDRVVLVYGMDSQGYIYPPQIADRKDNRKFDHYNYKHRTRNNWEPLKRRK